MNILENIEAVIFDFDGTLYENATVAKSLIKKYPLQMFGMLAERNVRKELKGKYFGSEEAFFEEYSKCLSAKAKTISKKNAVKWYFKYFVNGMVKVFKNFTPRENIPEIFNYLSEKNIKILVISDYDSVKERMESLRLPCDKIAAIHSSCSLGGLKPAPEIFLKPAADLGIKPENILVVGDRNDTDGEGARRAGMKFVQIKTIKNVKKEPPAENHPFVEWSEFCSMILESD